MDIKFSIIIPLYNKEDYVLDTLNSIFQQTFSNYEIIVVNDASTDNSLQLVKELNDRRIQIVENKENLGLSATRNAGISHAKNNYIAFLDADDCWHTTFLERIASLIEEFPDEGVFATFYEENFNGKRLSPKIKIPDHKKGTSFLVTNFFELNMGRLILTQSCLAAKKEVLENINGYDPNITFAEDIDFYIRCFSKHNLAYHYETCHTQNTTVTSSLTQSSTLDKTYPDLTKKLGLSLEIDKFIYFYMYCFCQRLKLEKRPDDAQKLHKQIKKKHLNYFQVLLLYLPQSLYYVVVKLKKFLMRIGVQINTYN